MNNEIRSLMSQYETSKDCSHAKFSLDNVETAEEMLELKIPDQYQEFLKEYGDGGVCGIELFGIGANNDLTFLKETLKYRGYGLPNNLVVIENCDEWLNCLDATSGGVVSWFLDGGIQPEYKDFDEFLLERIKDAIENI